MAHSSLSSTSTKWLPVTTSILGLNIAVFIAMLAGGVSAAGGNNEQLIRWGADYGPLTLGGQWWRVLTSTFVHIGIVHLAVNMWCLWNLGRLAELQLGRQRFALIYAGTGICGAFASLVWHPRVISAGASGALFGIAGALISAFRLGLVSISGQDLKQQIKSLVPFCAYNLILGALVPHIDNAAHVGGLIAGLVLGAFAAYTARAAKGKRMVVCASTILLLATGALAGYRNRYVVLAERAQDCLEKGDLKCATWNAEKAVSANPEDPWSLVALGDVHFRSTKLDDAEAAYKRALVADSNFQYAMWMLGMVASKRERFEESYAYFLRLLPWSLTTQTSRITSGLHLAVS